MKHAPVNTGLEHSSDLASTTLPKWMDEAILYLIDVAVFRDGDGDGIGDLEGVNQALDDLVDLGVNVIWLLPFYESPRRDNGYDITDHFAVDPRLGSLEDFSNLIEAAHERGVRVVIDLIGNHTSDEHPWFKSARRDRNHPDHDRYEWSDDPESAMPLKPVFPGFEESVWTYERHVDAWYLHHFYSFEPDLSTANPEIRGYIKDVLTFWLELGVDGFRIDAAPFLSEDAATEELDPHNILKQIRAWMDDVNPDACILAEADLPGDQLPAYFGNGDEVHGLWDYMLNRRLYLAIARESAAPVRASLLESPPTASGQGWVTFLRHHDELSLSFLGEEERQAIYDRLAPEPHMRIYERGVRRRLSTLLDNDWSLLRWIFSLHFSLPSPPMLLYGDEIGLQDDLTLPERAAIRTLMRWEDPAMTPSHMLLANIVSQHAAAVPIDPPPARDGENAFRDWMKSVIRHRQATIAPRRLSFELLDSGNDAVLAHSYKRESGRLICLHNFSNHDQPVAVDILGNVGQLVVGCEDALTFADDSGSGTISSRGFAWIAVDER